MLQPSRFESPINSDEHKHKRVIVDEIQKFPKILDVVHSQIQKTKRQFILTGSSSRRLKQQGLNLLAGRAWVYNFYPLSAIEIGAQFNLKRALQFGGLPDAYLAATDLDAREYLNAYVSTYLQKEIQQEQWVKNLEDTLIGWILPQTPAWGDAFENWILLEILKNANYKRLDWQFSYLRTKDDVEIDLIILRPGKNKLFIEIKSAEIVYERDANSLNQLGHDVEPAAEKWLLSLDKLDQKFGSTRALHWLKGLDELFDL